MLKYLHWVKINMLQHLQLELLNNGNLSHSQRNFY